MPGKRPSYRLVIGKITCGVFWPSQSKKGLDYFTGHLDITAITEMLKVEKINKKSFENREYDAVRAVLFVGDKEE